MDTIKLLDNLKVGMPLIVTIKWQDITYREVTLYAGTEGDGIYNFIDNDTSYRMTTGYIRDHVQISQELDQEGDIFTLTKLINKVKKEGVK